MGGKGAPPAKSLPSACGGVGQDPPAAEEMRPAQPRLCYAIAKASIEKGLDRIEKALKEAS